MKRILIAITVVFACTSLHALDFDLSQEAALTNGQLNLTNQEIDAFAARLSGVEPKARNPEEELLNWELKLVSQIRRLNEMCSSSTVGIDFYMHLNGTSLLAGRIADFRKYNHFPKDEALEIISRGLNVLQKTSPGTLETDMRKACDVLTSGT